jgi:hypothetical protein
MSSRIISVEELMRHWNPTVNSEHIWVIIDYEVYDIAQTIDMLSGKNN